MSMNTSRLEYFKRASLVLFCACLFSAFFSTGHIATPDGHVRLAQSQSIFEGNGFLMYVLYCIFEGRIRPDYYLQ